MNLSEVGKSGLQAYSGIISEAYTSKLQWPAAYDIYDEMRRRDPTIRSLWNALVLLAGTATWYVEPSGQEQIDLNAAEFLQSCLDDMSHPFEAAIEDALTCIFFGWSWQEICYKRRRGEKGKTASQYDDGRVGWRKFAVRRQSSLRRWEFDETGGLKAMVQAPAPDYGEIPLPIEKSLHFVGQRDGSNPEGLALLESLYEVWYYLKNLQIINGIGWQRSFVGLPVFEFEERPDDADKLQVKTVGEALTVDAKQYVSVPQKVKFRLESAQNSGAESLLNTIKYYRLLMYQTMLADFIDLGAGQTGSWALGTDKSNLFLMVVDALLDRIASPINRFGVPRLFAYNSFGMITGLPRVVHTKVEKPALGQLGSWLQQTMNLLNWTTEDEMWLRKRGGMPTVNLQRGQSEPEGGLAELAEEEGRDKERATLENILASEVEGFLQGQVRRVRKAVQDGGHDDDGFWEDENRSLNRTILPRLTEILNVLAGYAGEDFEQQYRISLDWSLVNAKAMEWARKYTGQLITRVNDTTRDNVRQAVANWIEVGGKLSDLTRALEPTFGRKRSELIAQTETTRAYAEANERQWKGSGLVEEWEWRTARDERVCSLICGPLHGKRFEIGKGPDMPAHPGCRCWKAPVVKVPGA